MSNQKINRAVRMGRLPLLSLGFVLSAFISAPVYAFTPFQAPLLSAAAVTPNVMLLLDNSGSMSALVLHKGYNKSITYPEALYCKSGKTCKVSNEDHWASVTNLQGHSAVASNNCPSGQYRLGRKGSDNKPGSSSNTRCIPFPDARQTNAAGALADDISISANYLNYLYDKVFDGTLAVTDIPTGHRMSVAKAVSKEVIAANIAEVRFGLASFNPVSNNQGAIIQNGLGASQAALDSQINKLYNTTWTPLAEGYYDVVRYYRGLRGWHTAAPSTPLDQVQYRCQKNFGIVVTDGAPTYDSDFFDSTNDPLKDNKDPAPATGADISGTDDLPNWDGLAPNAPAAYSDGPKSDNLGNEGNNLYLDDIAKFAYDIDIRPEATMKDTAGKGFNSGGFKQNIRTYTVGFALDHQMLKDAAAYGHGKYYTVEDSEGLSLALTQALNEISAQAGSGGAGASSSSSLTDSTVYYKSLYDPKDWRGTIEAYPLDPKTGRQKALLWSTDTTITPALNSAAYQTYNTSSNSVVSLDYASLSAAQQAVLNVGLPTSPAVTGAQLLSWTKGTAVTGLRDRQVLLGDIINSTLERASPTDMLASSLTGSTDYEAYLSAKSGMTSSLLVNSNDGFFHVIDAANGAHRYAYMPSTLFPSLKTIAATDYATSGAHKFMVDGAIRVGDAQLNSVWSTVAVAGMGGGGKSLFAVRLFDAGSSGNTVGALWEITAPAVADANNAWNDLGYTYGKPLIARNADNEWVAIFGNGYGSHQGKAALYVVKLRTGELLQKIVVDDNASGTPEKIATGSGLSSPQMVVNAQSQVQKVYAGDLRGNLWEFDFSSATVAIANDEAPLFVTGPTQPITVSPLVVEHETVGGVADGHMVLFGTGKLIEANEGKNDKLDTAEQAFYGVFDQDNGDEVEDEGENSPVAKSSLQAQSILGKIDIAGLVKTNTYYTTSDTQVNWLTQKGWYLPLSYNGVLEGERVIHPAQTTLGRVVFGTAKVDAADPCESSGGGSTIEVDAMTGAALGGALFDTNGDGVIDKKDASVSGLVHENGVPGQAVIIDTDELGGADVDDEIKDTQTKFVLGSNGTVDIFDECARRDMCIDPDLPPSSEGVSKRIMWRQLQ